METLFIYIAKSSVLIGLFYIAYYFLLRKETFFTANRWFLLAGLFTSIVLPLLVFTKIIWVDPVPMPNLNFQRTFIPPIIKKEEFRIDWNYIILAIYNIGFLVFLIKFVMDFYSLKIILKNKKVQQQADFKFIDTNENIAPFSFFNYIVYNSSLYTTTELENIIEHEKIHSDQNHTIDVLISRLFCMLFWFNPIIWLYKKAIIQNLEFIADSQASKKLSDKKGYQLTLLKITTQKNCVAITNHFYQSLIKKRIIMLNKTQSKKWNSWKYYAVIPALASFVLLFQVELVAQEKESKQTELKQQKTDKLDLLITKNTTDKEIKEFCEQLKKMYNIDLSFFNIKRNPNNEIINIESKYKNKTGSGTYSDLDNTPIKPFKFFYDDTKKETGYFNLDLNDLSNGKEIYINGNKSNQEELDKLDPKEIERIDVIKKNSNPTLNITTKNLTQPVKIKDKEIYIDVIKSTNKEFSKLDKNRIDQIDVNNKENIVSITTKTTTDEKPLIVVNGMLMKPGFDVTTIAPSTITSTEVLKGIKATGNYGIDHPYVITISTSDETYAPKPNLEKALVIIDGKETDYNTFLNLRGKVKEIKVTDCRIYEGTSQANKRSILRDYGLKAKNGVMVVKTIPLDKEQVKEVNGWKVSSAPVKDGIIKDVANQNKINYFNAVIIIDGKVINYSKEFHLLNPDKIASIKVQKVSDGSQKYKDEMVSKYGEKALNGIVEVETKLAFK